MLERKETAHHILYGCEAVVSKTLRHLESDFMDPGDCRDVPIRNLAIVE
jgi:hypothetical protein